jgi:hypothetical protein
MNLGWGILIGITAPFGVLATLVFTVLSIFNPTRKIAFPAMAFVIGYGLGNLVALEQWADSVLRFTWAKPYIQAPVHSLAYAILLAGVVFLLLTVRTRAVFKVLLGLSLILVCLPGFFIAIVDEVVWRIRPDLQFPGILIALLFSILFTVLLGAYCLRNATDFSWIKQRA